MILKVNFATWHPDNTPMRKQRITVYLLAYFDIFSKKMKIEGSAQSAVDIKKAVMVDHCISI